MYTFAVVIQYIAIFLALYGLGSLMNFRTGKDSRFLILSTLFLIIYDFGYLIELEAQSLDTALAGVKVQYLGIAFLATTLAMFVAEYCQKNVSNKFWTAYVIFDTLILLSVLGNKNHKWFFSSWEFIENAEFSHLLCNHSWLYWLFIISEFLLFLMSCNFLITRAKYIPRKSERHRIGIIILSASLPLLLLIIRPYGILNEWHPTSALASICYAYVTFNLTHYKKTNVVSLAVSALYNDLDNGVIIADIEGGFLECNKKAFEIFPDLRKYEVGEQIRKLGCNFVIQGFSPIINLNDRIYGPVSTLLMEGKKQVGFMVTIMDITDIQHTLDELERLKQLADDSNAAKSAFLANMSHEIRTPLNAIIGMAELSEREDSIVKVREYIDQIESAGKMLLDIVTEILDFSKVESGKLDILPIEFDTLDFLNGVINVINMRVGDKPIKFLVEIDPSIPKTVIADDVRIRQVLINFLGNAEKFTNKGYIKLKLTKEITSDPEIANFKFEVEDTGIGIDKDDIPKLFKAFSQVQGKENRKIVGTGLGLAISAELITLMGGTYKVESIYGQGTTFFFDIPVEIVDNTPVADGDKVQETEVAKCTNFFLFDIAKEDNRKRTETGAIIYEEKQYIGKKVLVVDDNRVNVKILTAFLKQYGVEFDACYSGAEAVEACENKEYDLIFMDHMMPEMDGVEATIAIRNSEKEYNKNVNIIACTANAQKDLEQVFMDSGMNGFVTKPIKVEVLRRVMEKYLS